jgi:hypothetical protein
MGKSDANNSRGWRRWLALAGLAVAVTLIIAAVLVLPYWAQLLAPSWLRRGCMIVFLEALLIAYGVAMAGSLFGPLCLVVGLRSTRDRARRLALARGLLLCVSTLIGLGLFEAGAACWLGWLHRSPMLPVVPDEPWTHFDILPPDKLPPAGSIATSPGPRPLRILVIGESSAEGQPFQPWLSVGQILGWQLQRVFPGREVAVDMWAEPGVTLAQMHFKLHRLTYRPDVLLLFSGHNEYQARFAWSRTIHYYGGRGADQPEPGFIDLWVKRSPLCRLALETIEQQRVSAPPGKFVTRELVDWPTCNRGEAVSLAAEFRQRLGMIADYCERIGTIPLYLITASNDAGFEPSRSILPRNFTAAARAKFAAEFLRARAAAAADPTKGVELFRSIVAAQPGFAEAHYRLAQFLERDGDWQGARDHYTQARELDAMPMRCPEPFREAYRSVAAEHPAVVLVDSPKVLAARAPHGILGDHEFHDAQHPTLGSYVALTQNVLDQFAARKLLNWPEATPPPRIDRGECARYFGLDRRRWKSVCERAAAFYALTAYIRYDPTERLAREKAYREAAAQIAAGAAPEATRIADLGENPPG